MGKPNILIVCSHPIPQGGAQTNRILSYARGLIELGNIVELVITIPYNNKYSEKMFGIFNNIPYKYLFKSKHNKILDRLFSHLSILIYLIHRFSYYKLKKFDTIIVQDNYIINRLILFVFKKLFNFILIRDETEFPNHLLKYNMSIFKLSYSLINVYIESRIFSGILVISTALKEYYELRVSNKTKLNIMPIMVETDRFSIKKNAPENYIAYCGDMNNNKDGVGYLINSFSMISSKYPEMKLLLIGMPVSKYIELVKNLKLENRIIFSGWVNRESMSELLCSAKILALARPLSKQSEGGFPTKLGEYLATGRPIIVTKVGDIPLYLEDQKTAFLVMPNSIDEFSAKIEYVMDNYSYATEVGLKGKELSNTIFNYKYQSKKLEEFIIQLKS